MTNPERLIAKVEAQGAPTSDHEVVVSLEDFFDGNDDPGSIGANLGDKHPSIAEFYRILKDIRSKSEVQDVLVRVCEYDDPDAWAYTDAAYIISSATTDQIREWVSALIPDEVVDEWMYGKPDAAPEVQAGMTAYSLWWD